MRLTILGGGLAGISLAYFLRDRDEIEQITILEKEHVIGGLCRSFNHNGLVYDVGPHILFSKDTEVLEFMLSLLGDNKKQLRRSNRVICNDKWLQYPFENDLSKLSPEDLEYCVNAFTHNPYENYDVKNMLQFFLKTFGEGITNTYLRPYNEKIWKYDPAFMDTQMVERIPKPPKEDIMRSANGETVEGYLHQLFFNYPQSGGIASLIDRLIDEYGKKINIQTDKEVIAVNKTSSRSPATVCCADGEKIESDLIVSTIPLPLLPALCSCDKVDVLEAAQNLRHNSTIIAIVTTKGDYCGDNFVFTIPDKDIIFHRITKLDFLGCSAESGTSYMMEISYRKDDRYCKMSDGDIFSKVLYGLEKIGFINDPSDVLDSKIHRFEYTYVIYDTMHKQNVTILRDWASRQGLILHGRFGNFEYWNMDTIIRKSMILSKEILEML